jgi:hypothetical protein
MDMVQSSAVHGSKVADFPGIFSNREPLNLEPLNLSKNIATIYFNLDGGQADALGSQLHNTNFINFNHNQTGGAAPGREREMTMIARDSFQPTRGESSIS